MGTGVAEHIIISEGTKILLGQGVVGFFVLAELIAIIVMFKMMWKREQDHTAHVQALEARNAELERQHSERMQGITAQCMKCLREHDKTYNDMVDEFGQKLGGVYSDMRTETINLRNEAIKMQEATTNAIVRTGDGLTTVTNLLNRLIGMLGRIQNGMGGD